VAIHGVTTDNDVMIITVQGIMIRLSVAGISLLGRNTQGVRLINLGKEDAIADVTLLASDGEDEEEDALAGEAGEEDEATLDGEEPESDGDLDTL
jgi:DNA gyrase subunit A